jgi:hypothetical protein
MPLLDNYFLRYNTCMSTILDTGSGRKLSYNGCTAGNFDLPDHVFFFILGLWSESSSNGFIVDITAPVMSKVPYFPADFGIKGLKQIYRLTRTPLKTGGELRCSGRVSSSCSTSGTCYVNLEMMRSMQVMNMHFYISGGKIFHYLNISSWFTSSMKVKWKVEDAESYIKRQFLSIKSHIGGEFMLSSQSVRKSRRDI